MVVVVGGGKMLPVFGNQRLRADKLSSELVNHKGPRPCPHGTGVCGRNIIHSLLSCSAQGLEKQPLQPAPEPTGVPQHLHCTGCKRTPCMQALVRQKKTTNSDNSDLQRFLEVCTVFPMKLYQCILDQVLSCNC